MNEQDEKIMIISLAPSILERDCHVEAGSIQSDSIHKVREIC
jgi:hypothetical protein